MGVPGGVKSEVLLFSAVLCLSLCVTERHG